MNKGPCLQFYIVGEEGKEIAFIMISVSLRCYTVNNIFKEKKLEGQ